VLPADNAKLWDTYYTDVYKDFRESTKQLEQIDVKGQGIEAVTKRVNEIAAEENKLREAKTTARREKIYVAYDKNNDGNIDESEAQTLVREYMQAKRKVLAEDIETDFEPLVLACGPLLSSIGAPEPFKVTFIEKLKENYAKTKPTLLKVATQILDRYHSNAAIARLAKDLITKLDTDKDGKISRAEFNKDWRKVIDEILGFDVIGARLTDMMVKLLESMIKKK